MSSRIASRGFYGVCERCFSEQWKKHPFGQPLHCYCPHHQALAFESSEGVSIRTNVTIEEYNRIVARSTGGSQPFFAPRRKMGG
ncbi:MAG: hypothetical protein HQL76_11850 [Magnetococcales bacterium]|nr:hypothetical protein [Magnetococcales bacterium]